MTDQNIATPLKVVRETLKYLRNAAPEQFDTFVRGYSQHCDNVTVAVIEADASEILTAKGRAQHARWLLKALQDTQNPPEPKKT